MGEDVSLSQMPLLNYSFKCERLSSPCREPGWFFLSTMVRIHKTVLFTFSKHLCDVIKREKNPEYCDSKQRTCIRGLY